MKKITSVLIAVIALLALISVLAICSTPLCVIRDFSGGYVTTNVTVRYGSGYIQADIESLQLTPNNRLEVYFEGIGAADKIDWKCVTNSSGAEITTASVVWRLQSYVTVNSETLTSATDITDFDSDCFSLFIPAVANSATINITGNVLLIDN